MSSSIPVHGSVDREPSEDSTNVDKHVLQEKENLHPTAPVEFPDPDEGKSDAERAKADRALLWKLDLHLIPWLCCLYLLSFLDRTNIGNAKISGLSTSLHPALTGGDYNAALSIFFVSYALAEPLTNILLKRLRPSIFIPIIMITWGVIMTLMGIVENWSGLMAARFFLGLAEAGLFPGINYYLSCWYKRSEFGIRAAIFFSAAAVSGSFGGLLAAAITQMDGLAGLHGWQWIFILEGIVTVVFGVASFKLVHDFPDEANFLSTDDKNRVLRRLKADKQASANHELFRMKYFWASLKDYKMYLGMAIYMGCDMPLYAFSLFLPTIVTGLGISKNATFNQLLTVPPYFVAGFMTIAIGFIADRTHQRGLCNMAVSMLGITGFAMLIGSADYKVQYAGVFLAAMGIYPCIANTISWMSNNAEGVYKRGVVLGFVIGWGNLNGVVSSNIYQSTDSPRFITGHAIVMAYMIVFLLGGSATLYLLLRRENAKRLAGARDGWLLKADGSQMNEAEAAELGDKRPDFIYTL